MAPVGSEVVMLASACGGDGYMVTGERIEWMLSPDGVGQFVEPGQREPFDFTGLFTGLPRKFDNRYAVNRTLSGEMQIHRGTPSPADDITVLPGQAWITVTSPTEGTSHVTAYAPEVEGWDRRQQAATIYWVDVQAAFPPPAISPVGARHTFTTLLTRQSNGTPVGNYRVRYEIAGGPPAGFMPDGATVAEVLSNDAGQASVEIFQQAPSAGTNQISIQVIRPQGVTPGGGASLAVASGSTLQTWTSSDLRIQVTGPPQAAPGATVTYRIDVSNPGAVAAANVVVTDQLPPGLTFLNSNPAANSSPSGNEWQIGELGAQQTRSIEANYRVGAAGSLEYCASATGAGNLTAKDCKPLAVAAPALSVTIGGPDAGVVGETVSYEIQVINNGAQPVIGLVITNRFDPGLQHAQAASPIERDLPDLAPGGTRRIAVQFRITQPGTLCQTVEVVGAGGVRGSARHCLIATAAPAGGETPTVPPADTGTAPGPVNPEPGLTVTVQAPERRRVGQLAEFRIEATNSGNVPLTNVKMTANFEPSLEPVAATNGWQQSGGALFWTIETLPPGRTMLREINFNTLQVSNKACVRVSVESTEGINKAEEGCVAVLPAEDAGTGQRPPTNDAPGRMSLSVADQVDPVRVGGTTTYQVTLTNGATEADRNVLLTVAIPPEITLKGTSGPVQGRITERKLTFDPIAELRKGETVTFSLEFTGRQAGTARLHTEVTSANQTQPISADETTEVVAE